jgi:hypothetical protein
VEDCFLSLVVFMYTAEASVERVYFGWQAGGNFAMYLMQNNGIYAT